MGNTDIFEVCVLGPIEVAVGPERHAVRGARSRAVLATLAWSARRWCSTGDIVAAVWRDEIPANPRKAVQMHVARLRATWGPSLIDSSHGGDYRLGTKGSTDVERFTSLALDASNALHEHRCEHAFTLACEALALWRGTPWTDLAGVEIDIERAALESARRCLEITRAQTIGTNADLAIALLDRLGVGSIRSTRHLELITQLQRLAAPR